MKGNKFEEEGNDNSLVKSLIASAKGTGRPARPILLGPFRIWIYPRILRSRRVKNAIAIKIIR